MKVFRNTFNDAAKAGFLAFLTSFSVFSVCFFGRWLFGKNNDSIFFIIAIIFCISSLLGGCIFLLHDYNCKLVISDLHIEFFDKDGKIARRSLRNCIGFKRALIGYSNTIQFKGEEDLLISGFSDLKMIQIRKCIHECVLLLNDTSY